MRHGVGTGFKHLFRGLGAFVCACTLAPAWRSRAWWVRSLAFPRLQLALLGGVALGLGWLARRKLEVGDWWLLGFAGAATATQLGHFAKYTPLMSKQVVRKPARPGATVTILTANVRMRNKSAERLLEVIRRRQPDLVLLLEVDQRWAGQLEVLNEDYPHRLARPQDNTYGMLLLSKLPLREPSVRFLVQEDVPSMRTKIGLRDGRDAWFYGVHPRPPMRSSADGEIELPGSAPRDAELVVVAMEVAEMGGPVIVAGDFNDVAWSHTTRRFQRLSRTLDPRVGRGLYSTFHASSRFLRFPLDHLFISEHFALVEFERESDIGSDHFPLYAELVLDPRAALEQEAPEPDPGDYEEAREDLVAGAKAANEA